MVKHMKTTLNLDDNVMQRLRQESARSGRTMSELVEAGLRRILVEAPSADAAKPTLQPLPTWHSGGAKVDIADRDALLDLMDGH